MRLWQRIFKKRKQEEAPGENWEQLVYARDDVDFDKEEERTRYITNCLEQMAEASKEINLLTGEYSLVTAYLTDIEEIEALPEHERQQLNQVAGKLAVLEKEREKYRDKKERMSDSDYYQIRKQEREIAEGIEKLKEEEHYHSLVKHDMKRLDAERHAYEFRREELETMMVNLRGMAVIFLSAFAVCILLLLVLQFAFEMNTTVGYFLAVMATAISITVLCVKHIDANKEVLKLDKSINKLIQLQNKVKIRYVNSKNLLNYLYMKYNTTSAAKLEKMWRNFQQEKEERKQYAEVWAQTEYYQKELVERMARYRVTAPDRWVSQATALLDDREMVEIRHELILRRQSLRKNLDYNNDVAQTARTEILDVAERYPFYAQEILEMVERYDRTGL
ncbi:MAG: hypothetical protein IJ833_09625 [Lachnospiraceae bacterium]|nr:hypothetical protein [Lachnospiraceae bacterium]